MALPQINSSRYTTVIPSLGKEVEFRPYLVKEEKILMIAMESQDQKQIFKAVKDVISNCIYDDINVNKLAVFDIETLFLNLRGKSVGEKIDLKMKCSHCETMNDVTVNLDDIDIPVVENEDITIQITDDIGVEMKYPTFDEISKYKDGELETVDGVFKLLKSCLKTIYDEDNVYDVSEESDKSINGFIESLTNPQFQKLTEFFNEMPTLKHDLEFECSNCGGKNNQELRGLQSFFT